MTFVREFYCPLLIIEDYIVLYKVNEKDKSVIIHRIVNGKTDYKNLFYYSYKNCNGTKETNYKVYHLPLENKTPIALDCTIGVFYTD